MSLIETADFDIRYSVPGDLEELKTWIQTRGILAYYPPADEQEVELFLRLWSAFFRYNASLTAVYKGVPIGIATLILMPYQKVAHHCLMQIIVDPEHQKQGVGFSLIKNVQHHAKKHFRLERIQVEILGESHLKPLLEKRGFFLIGKQERYCKLDGIYSPRYIMECEL